MNTAKNADESPNVIKYPPTYAATTKTTAHSPASICLKMFLKLIFIASFLPRNFQSLVKCGILRGVQFAEQLFIGL